MLDSVFLSSSTILSVVTVFLCLLLASLVRSTTGSSNRPAKLPPMITSLPLVGSVPFLPAYNRMHLFFMDKFLTMGGVIGFYLGNKFTVILNGRDAIYEGLVKTNDLANRPKAYFLSEHINKDYNGVVEHMYDEDFKKQRLLILKVFKEFGYGKGLMEERIRKEVDQIIDNIKAKSGTAFHPQEIIAGGIFNVMSSIFFNKRFHFDDPQLKLFRQVIHAFFTDNAALMMGDLAPVLRYTPSYKKKLQLAVSNRERFITCISKAILDAVKDRSAGESFVSSFLDKAGENYDYKQFTYMVRDMMIGGTETFTSGAQWFIINMANYPDIQAKVQEEIDAVVGHDREIALDDEKNLPAVMATLR